MRPSFPLLTSSFAPLPCYNAHVSLNTKIARRTLGTVSLVLAMAMLIAGETILKGRLSAIAFLFYWFACFVLTVLAIVAALLDARAVRTENQRQQLELLKKTLGTIHPRDRSGN
jgi:endonuclease/exonuclease/phosphatase (EEP) superfamily protein YafD